jgi:hypothetical protein
MSQPDDELKRSLGNLPSEDALETTEPTRKLILVEAAAEAVTESPSKDRPLTVEALAAVGSSVPAAGKIRELVTPTEVASLESPSKDRPVSLEMLAESEQSRGNETIRQPPVMPE